MTEAEWLAAADPLPMMRHLRTSEHEDRWHSRCTKWKLRCFAEALLGLIRCGAYGKHVGPDLEECVWHLIKDCTGFNGFNGFTQHPKPAAAALLRDIVGNPWAPLRLPNGSPIPCRRCEGDGWVCLDDGWGARGTCKVCNGKGHLNMFLPCPWLTPQVLAIAQSIYEQRTFGDTPILADALEDAGADTADLLDHLRSDRIHVRGCWAIDLILGKS
jgi:hypothetical protein